MSAEDPRIAFVEQLRSELLGVEEEVEANLRENPETGTSMLASFSTIVSSIRKTFMECKYPHVITIIHTHNHTHTSIHNTHQHVD